MNPEVTDLLGQLKRSHHEEPIPEGLSERMVRGLRARPERRSRSSGYSILALAAGLTLAYLGFQQLKAPAQPESASARAVPKSESLPVEQVPAARPLDPNDGGPKHGSSASKEEALVEEIRPECRPRESGYGTEPLLDDFEWVKPNEKPPMGAPVSAPVREGRAGAWRFITDQMNPSGPHDIAPSLVPARDRRGENAFAMRIETTRLEDWGASLEYTFRPSYCYDLSAYQGLVFRAKGPGRVRVAVREPSVMPKDLGGTCEKDCFNSHSTTVDLSKDWASYRVSWDRFRKRGYGQAALNPTRVNSVQFQIEAADTPSVMWFDDVGFATAASAVGPTAQPKKNQP